MNPTSTSDTIVEEITINAPAERVFDAFVQPDQRMQWWGHGQWRMTHAESDLRPGGKWELHVEGDGRRTSARGEYRTIERPRLLIFTWLPDWYENPTESLVRVDLEDNAGVTTVRLTHSGLTTDAARAGTAGWPDVLASLRTHVESGADAIDYAKRVQFDAPAEEVFAALTTLSGLAGWWAPATGSGTEGGELRLTFNHEDPLVIHVDHAQRPARVIWSVTACTFQPDWVGTNPSFTLSLSGTGGCELQFSHRGLTPKLECYDECSAGWDYFLPRLHSYVESGRGKTLGSGAANSSGQR